MTDVGRDVRARVDPASKAAAARLVAVVAARDHTTTAEILSVADTSEIARRLAHQIVADQWVRNPRDYTERLRRRAETEMDRAQREVLAERDPP